MPQLVRTSVLTLLIVSTAATADVYKSIDDEGNVTFSDSPQPGQQEAEKVQMRGVNSVNNPQRGLGGSLEERLSPSNGQVALYSASWCGVCDKARDYFETNDIAFVEYDIEESRRGKRHYRRLEADGVPVILYRGERMDGFSEGSFEAMYSQN